MVSKDQRSKMKLQIKDLKAGDVVYTEDRGQYVIAYDAFENEYNAGHWYTESTEFIDADSDPVTMAFSDKDGGKLFDNIDLT
jgi:hypothetical protein